MDIKRKLINIYNNGILINTYVVTDLTTVQEVATACSITLTEAQVLLDNRIIEDVNNYCCNSPLPIINSINIEADYSNPGSITITVDLTNVDSTIYTMTVKEGQTVLLTYTGNNLVNIISNLTFLPRQKRIFDIEVKSTNCTGEGSKIQTVSLGPEGFMYGMSNSLSGGVTNVGALYKNGVTGGQFSAQVGDSIQIQYFRVSWFNETKTATSVTNSGLTISFFNSPFTGIPLSNDIGSPLHARFRNLTTGSAWEDFGQQIPIVYP